METSRLGEAKRLCDQHSSRHTSVAFSTHMDVAERRSRKREGEESEGTAQLDALDLGFTF
jgi:hypothetical protein